MPLVTYIDVYRYMSQVPISTICHITYTFGQLFSSAIYRDTLMIILSPVYSVKAVRVSFIS